MNGHDLAKALRAAYLGLHRQTDAHFARWGVTANQFVVLGALSEADALTQRELVSRTSSDPSTLRAMLVLLERRGYVRRRAHPTDSRARSVSLTSKGRHLHGRMWADSEELRRRLIGVLEPAEARRLIAALQKMAMAMAMSEKPARGRSRSDDRQ